VFSRILSRLDAIDQRSAEMLAQVKKTNGRVSKLENWRWAVVGGLAVLTTLVGWYVVWSPRETTQQREERRAAAQPPADTDPYYRR
jgi:hypothetical protein